MSNKKFTFHIPTFLIIGIIFFLLQCRSKKDKASLAQHFAQYISAYTSGIISNADVILVEFAEDVSLNESELKEKEFIKIEPAIEGKIELVGNRVLRIKPSSLLPSNTLFTVKLNLEEVFKKDIDPKYFEFQFKTKPQILIVETQGLQSYDSKNLHWNQLEGVITSSDFLDVTKLEKTLKVVQNNKFLHIHWEHDYANKTYHFFVDSIYRGDKRGEIIIQWDGKPVGSEQSGEEKISIPSINEFDLFDFQVFHEPNQRIELYFSDPIDNSMDLHGIIHFESDNIDFTYDIQGTIIKIYPTSPIYGDYTLIIEPSLRNTMKRRLGKRIKRNVNFIQLKPAVKLVSEGNVLPLTENNAIFKFKAVNLKAVNVAIVKIFSNNIHQFFQENQFSGTDGLARVGRIVYRGEVQLISEAGNINYSRWNVFGLDLTKLVMLEPGAIYRVYITFDPSQSLYPCETALESSNKNTFTMKKIENIEEPGYYYGDPYMEMLTESRSDYDWEEYFYEDYDWDEYYRKREDPCSEYYYQNSSHFIAQNIFVSNFGIIAKLSNANHLWLYVNDLLSTDPVSNARIEVYNFQRQIIAQGETDGNGQVDFALQGKPFFVVVQKDGQYGYLRVDEGSALSTSTFDTEGFKAEQGLKGFLYTERGVWRPGDSIYINLIVENTFSEELKTMPAVMELYTPDRQLYKRIVNSKPFHGFYDFRTATDPEAPTGNWLAVAKIGATQFSKTLRIETIKPNRLKILLKYKGKFLDKNQKSVNLSAEWLHGGPASNFKAQVSLLIRKRTTFFQDFPEYKFDNPLQSFQPMEEVIFEGNLDEKGQAQIHFSLDVDKAPGMLEALFKTKVFEPSGDFSINVTPVPYSPYDAYVGIKLPKTKYWRNALDSQVENLIPIISVDPYGKLTKGRKLKVEIYELEDYWWWYSDLEENPSEYISDYKLKLIKSDIIENPTGKVYYKLKFDSPTWGTKLIKVTDLGSGHTTGAFFYTIHKDYWSVETGGGASDLLFFNTEKDVYKPGEEVKISLPSNIEGKVLLSIENHAKVIFSKWINLSKKNSFITFTATEEMSPNAYIHLTLIQPYHNTKNDRPIRLYGIQRLKVENPSSHLYPTIQMPDQVKPETTVEIKVSEKNGQAMTYTLAIVDEGILDLTNFVTPDPWNAFYGQYALGIKTFDMYKYVIGAYEGQLAGIYGIGGDQESSVKRDKVQQSRFKPMVVFLGPFYLREKGINKHSIQIPNYIGSVRVMVVAGNVTTRAYGSAEKRVKVKNELMVLPTLPRTLSPSEEIELPVTVFALENNIKNVQVTLKTDNLLKPLGSTSAQVTFKEPGEKTLSFRVKVKEQIGTAKVQVLATSGNSKAHYEVIVPVKIPSPKIHKVEQATLAAGATVEKVLKPLGLPGTNEAKLLIYGLPPIQLHQRLEFLITYPHGCLEQTVSSAFPQLYLDEIADLSPAQRRQVRTNIEAAINKLKHFQNHEGGFRLWPSDYIDEYDDWGTSYAGHFLLEAKTKGYLVPTNMLNKWRDFQREKANEWEPSLYTNYKYRQLQQAYRLYTLALAGKPFYAAMNRMREMNSLDPTAKLLLAATYYLAGKKDVAKSLASSISETQIPEYQDYYYTYGSALRDYAIHALAFLHMKDWSHAQKLILQIAKKLNSSNWYSTQTTSFSLLAYTRYARAFAKQLRVDVLIGNKNITLKTSKPLIEIPIAEFNKPIKVVNRSGSNLYVEFYNSGQPMTSEHVAYEKNITMNVTYFTINGNPIDLKNIKQNTEIVAKVEVKHNGTLPDIQNMALTQIFPSGFEIINQRLFGPSAQWVSSSYTYQDVRDDRVLTYFHLRRGETKTFYVILNAAYPGHYFLPPVKCEAMYDNSIISITDGQWINVIKNAPF